MASPRMATTQPIAVGERHPVDVQSHATKRAEGVTPPVDMDARKQEIIRHAVEHFLHDGQNRTDGVLIGEVAALVFEQTLDAVAGHVPAGETPHATGGIPNDELKHYASAVLGE